MTPPLMFTHCALQDCISVDPVHCFLGAITQPQCSHCRTASVWARGPSTCIRICFQPMFIHIMFTSFKLQDCVSVDPGAVYSGIWATSKILGKPPGRCVCGGA